MAVHEVRNLRLLPHPLREVVGEGVQVVPELFLGDVALGSGVDANDARALAQRFLRLGIVCADAGVDDAPGNQVDAGSYNFV